MLPVPSTCGVSTSFFLSPCLLYPPPPDSLQEIKAHASYIAVHHTFRPNTRTCTTAECQHAIRYIPVMYRLYIGLLARFANYNDNSKVIIAVFKIGVSNLLVHAVWNTRTTVHGYSLMPFVEWSEHQIHDTFEPY